MPAFAAQAKKPALGFAVKPILLNAQHAATAPEYPYQAVTLASSSVASSPKAPSSGVKIVLKIKKQR